jgi:hypothetical protein
MLKVLPSNIFRYRAAGPDVIGNNLEPDKSPGRGLTTR